MIQSRLTNSSSQVRTVDLLVKLVFGFLITGFIHLQYMISDSVSTEKSSNERRTSSGVWSIHLLCGEFDKKKDQA